MIFDARGYALTVSYLAPGLDRGSRRAAVMGGPCRRRWSAVDLDTGLGVVKLEGDGPWPIATLGDSRAVVAGGPNRHRRSSTRTMTSYQVTGAVNAVKRFSAYWEYMLDRAIIVAPGEPAVGRQRRRQRPGRADRGSRRSGSASRRT